MKSLSESCTRPFEVEEDGFVTWGQMLEQRSTNKAVPATECGFPDCESCEHYVTYSNGRYCTVPVVINKQIWHFSEDFMLKLGKRLDELENLVTDEILGEREDAENEVLGLQRAESHR